MTIWSVFRKICQTFSLAIDPFRVLVIFLLIVGGEMSGQDNTGSKATRLTAGSNLIGLWECLDPNTHWAIHNVEFKADGTYEETHARRGTTSGQYELNQDTLSLFLIVPTSTHTDAYGRIATRKLVQEKGIVQWVDANLIQYQVTDGNGTDVEKGKLYELQRVSSTDDAGKAGTLIGTWDRVDSNGQAIPGSIRLNLDGTYQYSGSNTQSDPRSIYKYQDSVLSFTWIQSPNNQFLIERGKVGWINKDRFSYRVLDATGPSQSLRGKVIEFRRQGTSTQ